MKLITEYNESNIECLVEKKENGVVITSSLLETSKAINANNNASVPLEQHNTCLEPVKELSLSSSSFTSGPKIYCP